MATESIVGDFALWAAVFAFGSIFSWLVWLTIRHYNYGKPAYEALAGDDMGDGHLEMTSDRFNDIETKQNELSDRMNDVENAVESIDGKTDRNYRLLEKIANKANVDGIFFRGGDSGPKAPDGGKPQPEDESDD